MSDLALYSDRSNGAPTVTSSRESRDAARDPALAAILLPHINGGDARNGKCDARECTEELDRSDRVTLEHFDNDGDGIEDDTGGGVNHAKLVRYLQPLCETLLLRSTHRRDNLAPEAKDSGVTVGKLLDDMLLCVQHARFTRDESSFVRSMLRDSVGEFLRKHGHLQSRDREDQFADALRNDDELETRRDFVALCGRAKASLTVDPGNLYARAKVTVGRGRIRAARVDRRKPAHLYPLSREETLTRVRVAQRQLRLLREAGVCDADTHHATLSDVSGVTSRVSRDNDSGDTSARRCASGINDGVACSGELIASKILNAYGRLGIVEPRLFSVQLEQA